MRQTCIIGFEMTADVRSNALVEATGSTPMRPLVVVGASGSDGLLQLRELLAALPQDLPAPVLAVLHRPADLPSHLRQVLGRASRLPVVESSDGDILHPGVCYLGLPDRHLTLGAGDTVGLEPDHVFRGRTVDLLFESAARNAGGRVIGVVLAGALDDGSRGLAAIKRAGGRAMVVDSAWAHRPGMPRSALLAVPDADVVGSVGEIAAAVSEAVRRLTPDPN